MAHSRVSKPMALADFIPANPLEEAVLQARAGARSLHDLLTDLAAAVLFVSSKTEVRADGTGFEPLLLGDRQQPLVAVFTDVERPAFHRAEASFILQMPGRDFFLRLPPGYGVVVNPGFVTQLIVTPEAADDFKRRLRGGQASKAVPSQ
jgi:SseB protein N-terminal domain